MLVTRFNPFSELRDLEQKLYGNLQTQNASLMLFSPAIATRESEKSYHIDLDIPGLKKEEINVDINDNILTISGERKFKNETSEKDFYKLETAYGKFQRSFTLPENADVLNICAKYDAGVLEIEIPKAIKEQNKQKIEIK